MSTTRVPGGVSRSAERSKLGCSQLQAHQREPCGVARPLRRSVTASVERPSQAAGERARLESSVHRASVLPGTLGPTSSYSCMPARCARVWRAEAHLGRGIVARPVARAVCCELDSVCVRLHGERDRARAAALHERVPKSSRSLPALAPSSPSDPTSPSTRSHAFTFLRLARQEYM